MNFCEQCGLRLSKENNFCSGCGHKIRRQTENLEPARPDKNPSFTTSTGNNQQTPSYPPQTHTSLQAERVSQSPASNPPPIKNQQVRRSQPVQAVDKNHMPLLLTISGILILLVIIGLAIFFFFDNKIEIDL